MTHVDGRSVAFKLPDPAYEQYTWAHEREHNPGSHPPLALWTPGMERPGEPGELPGSIKVNGYSYWRANAPFPADYERPPVDPSLGPLARWRTYWLPRVDAHTAALREFDPDRIEPGTWRSTLDALEDESGAVMLGVHLDTVIAVGEAARRFQKAFRVHFGEELTGDAHALLHGFMNATTRRASDLWALSRRVRSDQNLRVQLEAWEPGDPLPVAGGFDRELSAFLERWGETLDGGMQDLPSWSEDPSPVIRAMISQADMDDAEGPMDRHSRAMAERKKLEQWLGEQAAADPRASHLLDMLPAAQEHLPVTEDHNVLCDQRLAATSRRRWLSVGKHLLRRDLVGAPDDVFFYEYVELVELLEGGSPLPEAQVAERRERQAAYRAASPPPYLGLVPAGEKPSARAVGVLRGRAASQGVHQGRARVIRSLDEASRLAPGDVLVCKITSPAWTPIFALAGAVVTEAGDAFSHPAVVAREFGIPAVVGCEGATGHIEDGTMVEVDGGAGTVRLLE